MKTKITNISKIYTWNPDINQLDTISNKDILISDGKIVEISNEINDFDNSIDANNCVITPGFIDSHTHPIFVGNRSKEFILRLNGASYQEIEKMGGGINSSILNLRNASDEELLISSRNNLIPFIENGTTTVEAKSGYGQTVKDEIRSLEVIKKLNDELEIDIIPTFLGAHTLPPEYLNKKDDYVNLICDEMIPEISERKLAKFCDVFCEEGYFNVIDSEKIFNTAKEHGLVPRVHADEFVYSGAAELASKIGAVSADHLMAINDKGLKSLTGSNVVATLLPGTTFFLNIKKYANGRELIDYNIKVALASDFNPGTCTLRSLSNIMLLSILHCGLTIEEAFLGVTYNAACALQLENKVGLIKKNYNADMIFWNINDISEIPYWFDSTTAKINKVVKKGRVVEF